MKLNRNQPVLEDVGHFPWQRAYRIILPLACGVTSNTIAEHEHILVLPCVNDLYFLYKHFINTLDSFTHLRGMLAREGCFNANLRATHLNENSPAVQFCDRDKLPLSK